jgi:hypothetical protein
VPGSGEVRRRHSPVASAEADHVHHDHLRKEAWTMTLYRNLLFAELYRQELDYLLRQASVDNRPRGRAHHERTSDASLLELGSSTPALTAGMNAALSSSRAMVASTPRRIQLRSTHKVACLS